jgi:hypothetical protein
MRARLSLAVSLILALSSHASANPLDDLTKGGGDVCFHRVYDPEHLAKNPRQETTSMTLWITGTPIASGNAGLALTRRQDPSPVYLAASCDWEEYKPGQSQKSWMESYKKQAGAGCITLAVPDVFEASSAEEGNGVLLDPAPDGRTVTVHLQDPQTMVKRSNRARKLTIKLGKDDRIFLLRRTDLRHCARTKEAVTTPEPGVKRR